MSTPVSNDFPIVIGNETPRLRDNIFHRERTRIAASEGDDAESAAMIATVLHLNECAGAPLDAVNGVRPHCLHRHDVGHGDLLACRPAFGVELFFVADDPIDLRHGRESLCFGLRSTAVTNDAGIGCSRLRRRMVCLAGRTASAVTAQVFTTIAPSTPAVVAARRMTSDS
jgi:hypothetical protein